MVVYNERNVQVDKCKFCYKIYIYLWDSYFSLQNTENVLIFKPTFSLRMRMYSLEFISGYFFRVLAVHLIVL